MSKRKFGSSISGKGYYIALILCAAAIGISGYLYYRNTNNDPQLSNPTSATDGQQPNSGNVQAVATDPGQLPSKSTDPSSTAPTVSKTLKTASPLAGSVVSAYAMDSLSYNQTTRDWRVHDGIDIAAEAGTPVTAAADGTVYTVYEDDTMGTTVVIRHDNGYTTQYSSLASEVSVAPGDAVTLGQAIGTVGQTALLESAIGPHIHFSVACNGESVDPESFLTQQ